MALVLAATGTMPRRREPADAAPPPPRTGAPVTGVLMAAAALWVIGQWRAPTPAMLVGLAGVAGIAAASRLPGWPRPALTAPLAAIPFAGLLALAPGVPSIGWVRALVVGGVAAGAMAAARTDASWGATGLTPVLYAITAFGVFAAVPDTEEAAVLLGASVPAALCGWPLGRARLGPAGAAGAAALMVWVSAVGGRGRLPSIVGAVACLGLLATLPAGRWLADRWLGRTGCAGDPAGPAADAGAGGAGWHGGGGVTRGRHQQRAAGGRADGGGNHDCRSGRQHVADRTSVAVQSSS